VVLNLCSIEHLGFDGETYKSCWQNPRERLLCN